MRSLAPLAAAIILAMALGGCADSSGPSGEEGPDELGLDLNADDETGILRGVVVDAAIVPLQGIEVTATRGDEVHEMVTNENGAFGVGGLPAGSYVVRAAPPGFLAQETVAGVQAGEDEPPLVRFVLERDPELVPFVTEAQFQGRMECGFRGATGNVQVCRIVNDFAGDGTTNDNTRFQMDIEGTPSWIQAEMVWRSTQPLGERMGFTIQQYTQDGAGSYAGLNPHNQGTSPLVLSIDSDGETHCPECDDDPLNMSLWRELHFRALAGGLEQTEPPVPVCAPSTSVCAVETGVVVSQSFETFFHVFYRYAPPEGWTFGEDGAYPPP